MLNLLSRVPVFLSFCVVVATTESVRVAECRARCLDKFLTTGKPQDVKDAQCKGNPDCFMCWDSCQLLQENFAVWGSMCTDGAICQFPGCQQACGFVTVPDNNAVRPAPTAGRFPTPLQLLPRGETGVHVTWPRLEPTPATHVVFVLHRRTRTEAVTNQWHEVIQTCEHTAFVDNISSGKKVDLRVLAVVGHGQVAEVVATYAVHSSMHQDEESKFKKPAKAKEVTLSWHPRVVSMQATPRLSSVDVMVTWEPPVVSAREEYLVKWDVIEGSFDVTGHLYTDSTTITLTLAANSVFSIQVQLASGSMKSESVIVNTLQPTWKNEGPQRLTDEKDTLTTIQGECGLWWSIVAGVSTAVALALVLIVVMLVVRWWSTLFRNREASCSRSSKEETKRRKSPKPLDIEEGLYNLEQDPQSSPRLEGKLRNLHIFMESMEKVADSLSPVYANASLPVESQPSPPPYDQHELSILATPTRSFFRPHTPVFTNDKRSGENNNEGQDLPEQNPASQRSRPVSTQL